MENNLELQLGLSLPNRTQYKEILVDNGDTKMRKNATGEFVEKSKDEGGNYVRTKHGTSLEGIVIATRALLREKYNEDKAKAGEKRWWSSEFNPLVEDTVYIIKNKMIAFKGTYQEIKHSGDYVALNADGTVTNKFDYIAVLYVIMNGEVVKMKFTGRSRSNWFDYFNRLNKAKKSLLERVTRFKINVSEDEVNVECKFSSGPVIKEKQEIRSKAIRFIDELKGNTSVMIGAGEPEKLQLEAKEPIKVNLPDDQEVESEPAEGETFYNDPPEEPDDVTVIPF